MAHILLISSWYICSARRRITVPFSVRGSGLLSRVTRMSSLKMRLYAGAPRFVSSMIGLCVTIVLALGQESKTKGVPNSIAERGNLHIVVDVNLVVWYRLDQNAGLVAPAAEHDSRPNPIEAV